MSDRYPFTGDRNFSQSGTIIWNDQAGAQSSLDFSNVSNTTLTDSINDSYVTAVEDNEETQYLSILETSNDITLEALGNITLENSKDDSQENSDVNSKENLDINESEVNDQQVIMFTVDGSDDLYGLQLARDEQGNMQKYQFKFRLTEDGQLEAIPETIQLLANDTETNEENVENEVFIQEIANEEETETQVIYQEDGNVQETPTSEEQDEAVEEPAEKECRVQMYIKGEPDTMNEYEGDSVSSQVYIEEQLTQEELGESGEVNYGESETEVCLEENFSDREEVEESVDVKTGILTETTENPANIKQEMLQEDSQDVTDNVPNEDEECETYNDHTEVKPMAYHLARRNGDGELEIPVEQEDVEHIEENFVIDNGYIQVDEAHETVLDYEQYAPEEIHQMYEEAEVNGDQFLQGTEEETRINQVFIKDERFQTVSELNDGGSEEEEDEEQVADEGEEEETYYAEAGPENDSDNEDYEIVEGLHVTAEGDIDQDSCPPPSYHESDTILQEVLRRPTPGSERVNILKEPALKYAKDSKTKNNNKTVVYYMVPHVEKENVNSISVNYATNTVASHRPVRSNPRSILKSSFPEISKPEVKTVIDERYNKRFARSREAVEARLFNSFINKTTIPHAPVRQTRLPRKQQIKPVDNRRDEEIIVQEVMVGSNGFIENVEEKLKNKDKLEVTQYVVLSDSDEDYDPKKGSKKKKKRRKHKKSDMEDTEESDVSVIEIPSDDEENKSNQQDNTKRGRGRPKKPVDSSETADSTKRRRGRPPKSNRSDSDESPQKKSRTESDEVESDTAKKEFKCPHCTKTFPSQNSLSTHIHHHDLENSLRNKATAAKSSAVEYKHRCEACQATFKNSILLKRHECPKQAQKSTKRVECGVCKKSFPDVTALGVHKRVHVKENLVNTTTVVKVSPKKSQPRPSTSKPRSPKKATSSKATTSRATTFKCKDCSRVCFSQESLDLHEKTHRKFTCATCGSAFPSRLLLDTHVRVSCVKSSPHFNKRLSFKIKKSFVQSPRRKSGRFSRRSGLPGLNSTEAGKAVLNNTLGLKMECEHCGERFTMFQDYFKHQVKMHGLETPDKSVLAEQKKRLHKPKSLHGGIPARDGMRKVFAEIRSKMALLTPKKDAA